MQRKALYVLLLLALIAAPFVGAYPVFVMKVLCFALFAAAFNLLIGYTGLLSFGHAMFLATAGYVTGYAIQTLTLSPELGVVAGTVAATLLGLVVGLFAIRRQGIYFAMVTLALAQMVYFVFLQAPFTHGEDGLQGVPRGKLFGVLSLSSDLTLYFVVLAVMVLAFLLIVRIVHSPFGQVLIAIKESEPRAISLGYDTNRFKLLAFILSAGLAGLAGSLKVLVLGFETLGLSPELGVLAGTVSATLLGFVVGIFAIRRQGIYFAMVTLALAQMVYFVFLQAPFTHGEDGLQGVPRGKLFGLISLDSDLALYYVVLVAMVLAFLLIVRIVHSPFGQVLGAIKENEPRAVSLGYDTDRFKLLAFVLSAGLAGLAGSLKVLVLGFETLGDAYWTMSGLVILMTLVGGMGTLFGPLVGAALIVALEDRLGDIGTALAHLTGVDWFRSLGESATIVTGLIFIACVLAFRRGIVGEIVSRVRPLRA